MVVYTILWVDAHNIGRCGAWHLWDAAIAAMGDSLDIKRVAMIRNSFVFMTSRL